MAAFVKGIDPNHLVSVGLMGWYGASTPERYAPSPAHLTHTPIPHHAARAVAEQSYSDVLPSIDATPLCYSAGRPSLWTTGLLQRSQPI